MTSRLKHGSKLAKSAVLVVLLAFFPSAAANTYFTDEPDSCRIIGDVDVYGIGIRLGYYLQYIAAALYVVGKRPDDLKGA
ncbi:hypothetical protein F5882DRAFT_465435 [Hyaloscypha sp. PMI_1271]|nr:hypothetical protein F5882DRAFT_465435 [Hyaloscypha sp. PMI_1271]